MMQQQKTDAARNNTQCGSSGHNKKPIQQINAIAAAADDLPGRRNEIKHK
jgi:hypothetical protein